MNTWAAIGSGAVGATVLTAVHETARQRWDDAPRMDVLGRRAIARSLEYVGVEPPRGERLQQTALAGDVVSNSLYYSLVAAGSPEGAVTRGALLGLAAGVGAVLLPGPLGLGEKPSNRTRQTQVATVAWYLLGGLAAGVTYRLLGGRRYQGK